MLRFLPGFDLPPLFRIQNSLPRLFRFRNSRLAINTPSGTSCWTRSWIMALRRMSSGFRRISGGVRRRLDDGGTLLLGGRLCEGGGRIELPSPIGCGALPGEPLPSIGVQSDAEGFRPTGPGAAGLLSVWAVGAVRGEMRGMRGDGPNAKSPAEAGVSVNSGRIRSFLRAISPAMEEPRRLLLIFDGRPLCFIHRRPHRVRVDPHAAREQAAFRGAVDRHHSVTIRAGEPILAPIILLAVADRVDRVAMGPLYDHALINHALINR